MKTLFILLFICTASLVQSPSQKIVEILSKRFQYSNIYITIDINEKGMEKHVMLTNHTLHNYFLNEYNKLYKGDYSKFLKSLLIKKKSLNSSSLNRISYEVINVNNKIFAYYKNYGTEYIIKNYLVSSNNRLRAKILDRETFKGLVLIMFEQNYLVSFDDYSGYYYFSK